MPAQTTFGTNGATGGGFSAFKGLQPFFSEERLDVRPNWSWQRRSAKTWRDPKRWNSCWSWGCRVGGGDIQGYDGGCGLSRLDLFEPYSCDGPGNQTRRFFVGIAKDSVGTPVPSAIVQGFITSTDAYIGETVAAADGTYTLPTGTMAGVQHYLVAYKAGAPDIAGTSVNTLTDTGVDGS